jgi:glutathione S-transferase
MRLIGRYASPYVRRVAISMQHYDLPYEHVSLMPFGESKQVLAKINPIARVPVLELDSGEQLFDSAAILDHLDAIVWPKRALVPAEGFARRKVLSHLAVELGTMDKLVAVLYERHFRPQGKWHQPWIDACEKQIRDGFTWLDRQFAGVWLSGGEMSQADLSLAVFWSFGCAKRPGFFGRLDCPRISELTGRLANTAPFKNTEPETEMLSTDLASNSPR